MQLMLASIGAYAPGPHSVQVNALTEKSRAVSLKVPFGHGTFSIDAGRGPPLSLYVALYGPRNLNPGAATPVSQSDCEVDPLCFVAVFIGHGLHFTFPRSS